MVTNTQNYYFPIVLLHFTIVYALEVTYIDNVYVVKIPYNGVHIFFNSMFSEVFLVALSWS